MNKAEKLMTHNAKKGLFIVQGSKEGLKEGASYSDSEVDSR